MKVIINVTKGLGILLYLLVALILGYAWEFVSTTVVMIVKFPWRCSCKKQGHEWVCHGTGGWGLGPLYPFTCEKCGKRSRGDMKDFDNKPFTAKLKI
ncbi:MULTISPECIES: hypothetical protein [Bacillus cereus group]|uniref:hypothetical protein n=1 Tax=Bacillus cereus group TaxID=86661 RepID=UPI000BF64283|nr:hypothetical protein [Bacillus cereus]PEZ75151.1 hypothetical protein CN410_13615 [Bacillus anthracis]PGW06650.1 hypothetical protein COD97_26870 [Bacillus cereus]